MLSNLKYKGHSIFQKTDTLDFLTKERAVNNGEVSIYYVERSQFGFEHRVLIGFFCIILETKSKRSIISWI